MKHITNKEYEEFQKYKEDKLYGRILTPDSLRFICATENHALDTIGKSMFEKFVEIQRYQL